MTVKDDVLAISVGWGESKHRKARMFRFQARHLSRKALARKKARRRMTTESRRRNR